MSVDFGSVMGEKTGVSVPYGSVFWLVLKLAWMSNDDGEEGCLPGGKRLLDVQTSWVGRWGSVAERDRRTRQTQAPSLDDLATCMTAWQPSKWQMAMWRLTHCCQFCWSWFNVILNFRRSVWRWKPVEWIFLKLLSMLPWVMRIVFAFSYFVYLICFICLYLLWHSLCDIWNSVLVAIVQLLRLFTILV